MGGSVGAAHFFSFSQRPTDYLQAPSDLQAATSAAWKSATLVGSDRNRPRAVSTLAFQASFATTPCVRLPTTVSLVQSLPADCRYSLNRDWLQSVRAQMEPLTGLKAS